MISVKEQIVHELHMPARRVFKRRAVLLKGIDDLWQADLVEIIPHARFNEGHKYLLTVINCFFKFAWVAPIKNKTAAEVTKAFEKILLDTRKPTNLQVDIGKEFYNKQFEKLMKVNSINHYSTYSNLRASMVERFNHTLKTAMWKKFSLQGNYNWLPILQLLVSKYNNTKHRTIKIVPSAVSGNKIEAQLLRDVYGKKTAAPINKAKFKVGDYVRISKYKAQFTKGYQPSWPTEIFKIAEVRKTVPVTFHLKDEQGQMIAGGFYQEELQSICEVSRLLSSREGYKKKR